MLLSRARTISSTIRRNSTSTLKKDMCESHHEPIRIIIRDSLSANLHILFLTNATFRTSLFTGRFDLRHDSIYGGLIVTKESCVEMGMHRLASHIRISALDCTKDSDMLSKRKRNGLGKQ
jgi:hypothetical protein